MIPWLLAGSVIGVLNGLFRWWTVNRLRSDAPARALRLVWGGLLLRLGLVVALLSVALQFGLGPCLLTFAGIWWMRWAMVVLFQHKAKFDT